VLVESWSNCGRWCLLLLLLLLIPLSD
jgi:hypothetical protein